MKIILKISYHEYWKFTKPWNFYHKLFIKFQIKGKNNLQEIKSILFGTSKNLISQIIHLSCHDLNIYSYDFLLLSLRRI
jgi:hypothetical protein